MREGMMKVKVTAAALRRRVWDRLSIEFRSSHRVLPIETTSP
jgi:hypothetical protein